MVVIISNVVMVKVLLVCWGLCGEGKVVGLLAGMVGNVGESCDGG